MKKPYNLLTIEDVKEGDLVFAKIATKFIKDYTVSSVEQVTSEQDFVINISLNGKPMGYANSALAIVVNEKGVYWGRNYYKKIENHFKKKELGRKKKELGWKPTVHLKEPL